MLDNTLAGFILSKATQSRKEAKKKDRKGKKKSSSKKQDSKQQPSNLLTGALSSVTNLFKPESGKAEEVESKSPRTSGGATGLAKILTEGFGSLTADTLGLSSGLAAITNILNQQLKAQSFTATGVQTITSILSDQLENQTSIVSGIKSLRPGGGGGKAPRARGSGGGARGGGNDGNTLTGALLQRAADMGLGATVTGALSNLAKSPQGWAVLLTLIGSIAKIKEQERMKPFVDTTKAQIEEENKKEDTPWYQKLGNMFAGQALTSPTGPAGGPLSFPAGSPGSMYSSGGIIKYSSGTMKFAGGMMGGGTNAMIGEAGKEAVVDLNTKSARDMFNSTPSSTSKGESDPGMQASGAATLAVVDQFIQGMGPLGAPVAQALGPDISNLSRTFGMSQTLPNIKLGGGRFKEDGSAKKTRDKFLENLIAGSLEALDAKKKDKETVKPNETPPPPPGNPGPKPDKPEETKPSGKNGGGANKPNNGTDKPMDDHQRSDRGYAYEPNLSDNEKRGITDQPDKASNQVHLPIKGYPNHFVLSDRSNGNFEIWEKGLWGILGNKPKVVGSAKDKTTGKYKDPLFAAAYNEVRANYLNTGRRIGVQFGYITPDEVARYTETRNNGGERGGKFQPVKSYGEGGSEVVKKPWWDFLGWFTALDQVKKGNTGIYSDTLGGRMANRTAETNKAMQMLRPNGYEDGGAMKQPTIRDDVDDIRRMIAASQMRQQGRNLLGTDEDFPGQRAVVGDDLKPKSTTSVSPATSRNVSSSGNFAFPTEEFNDEVGAAIINLYTDGGNSSTIPIPPPQEGTSTSAYVSNAWGGGVAFSVLSINPWGTGQ